MFNPTTHPSKNKPRRRGILYVRVSSDDQIEGTSLSQQEKEGKRYFKQHNIELVKIFREEGRSAKTANRKEFLRAIEYCRRYKKKYPIDVFAVYRMDRFARNVEDHVMVRRKLLNFNTELVSITEPIDGSPMGKVLETMLAAFAQFDNDLRGQRSKDGLYAKIREGYWPYNAFLGYESSQCRKQGLKKILPDTPHPQLFPIIQKGLKRFAQGNYKTHKELERDLEIWGLSKFRGKKTTHKLVYYMLDDKHLAFYAGFILDPITKELIPGKHQAMITIDEMHRIKFICNSKRVQPDSKTVFRDEFPLRQTVGCTSCGRGLTAAYSTGRNKKYPYYRCANRECKLHGKGIARDHLHNRFEELLQAIVPHEGFWKAFKKSVLKRWEQECTEHQQARKHFDQEVQKLEEKLERLYDAYLEGIFSTKEAYFQKKEKLETQITAAKISRNENHIEELNLEVILIKAEAYTQSIVKMWQDLLRPESRKKFLQFVFHGGLTYDKKTDTWNHGLGYLFKVYKENSGSERDDSQKSSEVPLTALAWNQFIRQMIVFAREE